MTIPSDADVSDGQCYICHDTPTPSSPTTTSDANDTSDAMTLRISPCGHCTLHVHTACLHQHLLHESDKGTAVVVNIPPDNVPIVYASCTVCKHRYEHNSAALVERLRERALSRRGAAVVPPELLALLRTMLQRIQPDTMEMLVHALQRVMHSVSQVPSTQLVHDVHTTLCMTRRAVIFMLVMAFTLTMGILRLVMLFLQQ